jgi:hypothetical protein
MDNDTTELPEVTEQHAQLRREVRFYLIVFALYLGGVVVGLFNGSV